MKAANSLMGTRSMGPQVVLAAQAGLSEMKTMGIMPSRWNSKKEASRLLRLITPRAGSSGCPAYGVARPTDTGIDGQLTGGGAGPLAASVTPKRGAVIGPAGRGAGSETSRILLRGHRAAAPVPPAPPGRQPVQQSPGLQPACTLSCCLLCVRLARPPSYHRECTGDARLAPAVKRNGRPRSRPVRAGRPRAHRPIRLCKRSGASDPVQLIVLAATKLSLPYVLSQSGTQVKAAPPIVTCSSSTTGGWLKPRLH